MKIALSASYFNCPPVAVLLHSCDIVYTTNKHAIANFAHKDIRPITKVPPGKPPADVEIVEFPELFKIFNDWVANTATDEDLIHWSQYFSTMDADSMRAKARLIRAV